MNETIKTIEHDAKNLPGNSGNGGRGGRFVIGGKAGPGRPRGARSKLGEAFLEDLRDSWNECGATALRRCAEQDPTGYIKVIASLLPKQATLDVNVDVVHDVNSTLEAYRTLSAMVGADPRAGLRRLRQLGPDIIDHERD